MKNRIVSLFLAATMVLGLCPVSIRAEAASADMVQVQEAPETETKQSSPVDEEPVITGTGSKEELPPEEPVIIGTGEEQGAASEEVKQEETKQEETKQEASQESQDFWNEDEELMLYGLSDLDTEEDGKLHSAGTYDLDTVISQTVNWKRGTNEKVLNEDFLGAVSSTNTDWTVFFLGRLGIKDDYAAFLTRANTYVKGKYDENPTFGLSNSKPTEWQRLAIAVQAAGGDATDIGGKNLIADGVYNCILGDMLWEQGINSMVWGLLALDTKGYEIPEGAKYTREDIIQHILKEQKRNGGWAFGGTKADADMTAMAIYALAPYYASNAEVKSAGDKGLDILRNKVSTDGDVYSEQPNGISTEKVYNWESTAQAIMAFAAMGIDPASITNAETGKSLFDGLMKYYMTGTGGFKHKTDDKEADLMPTDQAMEAIAAYLYYKEGLSVYDFRAKANTTQYVAQADNGSVFTAETGSAADLYVGSEVTKLSFTNLPVGNYDAAEVTVGEQSWKTGIRGADGYTPVNGAIPVADGTVLRIAVTKQDGSTENWTLTVHTSADAETKAVMDRIDALPDVGVLTLDDKATVLSVREAYNKLKDAEKAQVTNADKLAELEAQLTKLEAAAEKELTAKRAALEKNVNVIATPVKIGDKSLVNQYLLELNALGDWDGKAAMEKKLNGYLTDIAARQKLVDDLDKDIWNQVDPLRVSQSKAGTVKKLMSRYAALRLDEQKLLANVQSLQDAAVIIDSLEDGIVPKKVFENLMSTKETFVYYGLTPDGDAYTLTWDGKTVTSAKDVQAGVKMTTGSGTANGTAAQIEFYQSGSMNGSVTLSAETSVKSGSWKTYWMNPDKLKIQSAKTATVSSGKLNMTVTIGGRYWLSTKDLRLEGTTASGRTTEISSILSTQGVKSLINNGKTTISSIQSTGSKGGSTTLGTRKALENGMVSSSELKGIQGKNVNLKANGDISDTVSYTFTINGEDVKVTKDWKYNIQTDCKYEDDIKELAVKPLILCMEGTGTFPGKMLLTLHTEVADGELLLFKYDAINRQAEYVKKVTVEDGVMEFTLQESGHYFLAKRALAGSLNDSTDAEQAVIKNESDAAGDTPWDESQEAVVLGNGQEAQRKTETIRWVLIGLIALMCGATVVWILHNKRLEAREAADEAADNASETDDRKDGEE